MQINKLIAERIYVLGNLLTTLGDQAFKSVQLTTKTAAVLWCIRAGYTKNSDLCTFLDGTPSVIAQRVAGLETQKLITRRVDTHDRRVWHFALTKKGEKIIDQAQPAYTAATSAVLEGFSTTEKKQLFAMLSRIRENLLTTKKR